MCCLAIPVAQNNLGDERYSRLRCVWSEGRKRARDTLALKFSKTAAAQEESPTSTVSTLGLAEDLQPRMYIAGLCIPYVSITKKK